MQKRSIGFLGQNLSVTLLLALLLVTLIGGWMVEIADSSRLTLPEITEQLICPCGCGKRVKACQCSTATEIRSHLQDQLRQGVSVRVIREDYAQRYGPQYLVPTDRSEVVEIPLVEKCGKCHGDAPETWEWKHSGHARSLQSLSKGTRPDTTCLSCHSSTYRQETSASSWGGGNQSYKRLDRYDPVACSSCHQHGSPYAHYLVLPPDKLCESCHKRTKG